jgi:hypothetical protein
VVAELLNHLPRQVLHHEQPQCEVALGRGLIIISLLPRQRLL